MIELYSDRAKANAVYSLIFLFLVDLLAFATAFGWCESTLIVVLVNRVLSDGSVYWPYIRRPVKASNC